MRPEQGACSRRHPSLQLRFAAYSPGHRISGETGSNGMGRIAVYRMRFDLSIYFPPSHPVCQPAQPLRPRQLSAGGERPTCVVPVPYVSIIPREGHIHGGSKTRSSTAFCKCFLPGKRIGTNLPGADVKTGSSLVRTTPRQLTPSTLQGNPKKGPAPNRPDFFQTGGAAGDEGSGRTRGHRRYRRFPPLFLHRRRHGREARLLPR